MTLTLQTRLRQFIAALFTEQLDPGRAGAAVFLGIFIGIVPIYGFQTLVAVGLALLFKLNKPLVLASTFINNPLLQPLIVVGSVELGCLLRGGTFQPWSLAALAGPHMKEEILSLAVGSVALGVIVGSIGAAITAAVVYLKAPRYVELRERIRFVNRTFAQSASFDRGFVRWKMRLDRIFSLLVAEGLGAGTVVDLGCGYGMALCFAAFGEKQRRICGCDLNAHRIEVAKQALGALNAEVCVADVRNYELPQADLILILDVLQYLSAEEQLVLLRRCCAALVPQGRLIFRVHDRQRGLWTAITMAFDGLLFRCEHVGAKPLMLTGEQYQNLLVDAGMQVETRRFRNRLPLAHILFVAKKPLSEIAS